MRHDKWMRTCIKFTNKSQAAPYKHACIIVRGGSIVSIGLNRVKNNWFSNTCYRMKTVHSEIDALRNMDKKDVKGSVLYVSGITMAKNLVNSKPCEECQKEINVYIEKYGLKAVFYSTPDGIKELVRDERKVYKV